MIATQYPEINEAVDTIYQISEDEHIRQIYEAREDALRTERDVALKMEELTKELAAKNKELSAQAEENARLKAQLAKYQNKQ